MLRELNVVEQRYHAILEVLSGAPVIEVAERYGVIWQTVHRWMARYRAEGLDGLADRSHAPRHHPWRIPAETEAPICELRRATAVGRRAAWSSGWAAVVREPGAACQVRLLSPCGCGVLRRRIV